MKKINWLLILLLWILVWGLLMKFWWFEIVSDMIKVENNIEENVNKYERFELVDNILNQWYYEYEKIDETDMINEALKSYVDGIGDPYTVYMDAEQSSGFEKSLEWEEDFEWIWAIVTKKDYYVQIEEVLKESPAFKAWLKPLDRVIKIDSGFVDSETLEEATERMKWPAGTKVKLFIERYSNEDTKEIFEKEILREKINIPSVQTKILEIWEKKIWYIEIFLIWEETENLFKKEIQELSKNNLNGIILDLRWNGGWLMPIAVEIVSHFVNKWDLVVSAKYKWYEDEKYYSKWYWDFQWMKTVVLIDGMTASAGEIIAMALQEQIWATLLWTTTFWKGTIQTLNEFENWDSLKYTIWKWFAPSDKNIDKIGVSPDIIIEFDVDNYVDNNIDNQLEEAKNQFNL